MVWWIDISLGAIVSIAFVLAGILYAWSKDELNDLFSKLKVNKIVLLVSAIFAGAVLAFAVGTVWVDVLSLILFFAIVTIGSIAFVRTEKKAAIKYSITLAIIFFISFAVIYALRI